MLGGAPRGCATVPMLSNARWCCYVAAPCRLQIVGQHTGWRARMKLPLALSHQLDGRARFPGGESP